MTSDAGIGDTYYSVGFTTSDAGEGIQDRVRRVVRDHARLAVDAATLAPEEDLYEAGMTSRASVSVMLELENEFDVEFPDEMLRRDVFESIAAMTLAIERLINDG